MFTQGEEEGHLFLISHLLALREHLSSFQVDFASTECELDFSHVRDVFSRVLAGDAKFLIEDGLMGIVQHSGVTLTQSVHDSKKDLEHALKSRCESFMMLVTRHAISPLLNHLAMVGPPVAGSKLGLFEAPVLWAMVLTMPPIPRSCKQPKMQTKW